MDYQALLNSFDGDAELLQEMINVFMENFPSQLAAVREAIERQDSAKIERSAHILKGSVSIFGVPAVFEAVLKIETMGRIRDLSASRESFQFMQTQIQQLEAGLAAFSSEAVS